MKPIPFSKAHFVQSVLDLSTLPSLHTPSGKKMPEIAFIGRSNVGKSSLINHLLHTKKLAYVSATPGKTQLLNFFVVDEELALVDLPGYGYSKVAKGLKEKWGKNLQLYLQERPTLVLLLVLLDSRHLPSKDDLAFISWALHEKKELLLVFTKGDKLSSSLRDRNIQASLKHLHAAFPISKLPYVSYSIKEAKARFTLIEKINEILLSKTS